MFDAGAGKYRLIRSNGQDEALLLVIIRTDVPQITPAPFITRIRRVTVQRAMSPLAPQCTLYPVQAADTAVLAHTAGRRLYRDIAAYRAGDDLGG